MVHVSFMETNIKRKIFESPIRIQDINSSDNQQLYKKCLVLKISNQKLKIIFRNLVGSTMQILLRTVGLSSRIQLAVKQAVEQTVKQVIIEGQVVKCDIKDNQLDYLANYMVFWRLQGKRLLIINNGIKNSLGEKSQRMVLLVGFRFFRGYHLHCPFLHFTSHKNSPKSNLKEKGKFSRKLKLSSKISNTMIEYKIINLLKKYSLMISSLTFKINIQINDRLQKLAFHFSFIFFQSLYLSVRSMHSFKVESLYLFTKLEIISSTFVVRLFWFRQSSLILYLSFRFYLAMYSYSYEVLLFDIRVSMFEVQLLIVVVVLFVISTSFFVFMYRVQSQLYFFSQFRHQFTQFSYWLRGTIPELDVGVKGPDGTMEVKKFPSITGGKA